MREVRGTACLSLVFALLFHSFSYSWRRWIQVHAVQKVSSGPASSSFKTYGFESREDSGSCENSYGSVRGVLGRFIQVLPTAIDSYCDPYRL